MKFQITYDKPKRIRFKCGSFAFDKSLENSIYELFISKDFVTSVDVHHQNGGILVQYKDGFRKDVINIVEKLNPKKLEIVQTTEYQIKEIDNNFKNDLSKLVINRILLKALLPTPLVRIKTIFNSLEYISKGLKSLAKCKLNVDVLDGASISACLLQKNYKTAGTIMFLLSISGLLEDYTKARTRAVLTDSLAIKTEKVWLVTGQTDVLIPISELKVGDCIRVRTGSVIPVDGEIVNGEASIDEKSMTGEPLAVMKSTHATVFAGTVIEEGSIVIKVRELSSNTKISKIIELIDNSENLKASVQSKAETLADNIVPFSFLAFGLTWLITRNVTKAVSILMVDYSCAIKLSTPIAVISAIKEASDYDITVKGGKYLEEFSVADTIVFDKTGTLTNAEPKLEKVIPFGKYSEEEVLKISACLEEHFPHSVARAIVEGAKVRNINHEEEHAEVNYIVAHGISTTLHGQKAIIGSRHFVVEDEHITISNEQQQKIDNLSGACSVIYLAIGDRLAGALCISDPPRLDAKDTISDLKLLGFDRVVMLTGDSSKTAEVISKQLGISEYHAQILPEDKHFYVEKLKEDNHHVVMVGDGINDAPALAVANVSVAMSDASDIAKETADITLRGSNLAELIRMRNLSVKLMQRIKTNYRFIVGFNSTLLALGFFGLISPSTSALLHNASTMMICVKSMTPLLNKDNNLEI
ncbi:MAG: heavy metal translocating P-type ATPase [Oscillospiraceae bacterium]